ncbi:MAG: hypothetical protein WA885_04190 [Phormidesmis sp.]
MLYKQITKTAYVGAIATLIGFIAPLTIAKASQAAPDAGLQLAQFAASDVRSLSVTGNGRAFAPAEQAALVFAYTLDPYSETPDNPMVSPLSPVVITESDLQPVKAALIGAGVAESAISFAPDVYSYSALRMVVKISNPTRERLNTLVELANAAAIADKKLVPSPVNALYSARNCDAAEANARQIALTQARNQATALADTSDIQLGELFFISSYITWGYFGATPGSCPTNLDEILRYINQYGVQPYDSSLPLEVPVDVSVSVTYKIE